jgi:hypothetical protein
LLIAITSPKLSPPKHFHSQSLPEAQSILFSQGKRNRMYCFEDVAALPDKGKGLLVDEFLQNKYSVIRTRAQLFALEEVKRIGPLGYINYNFAIVSFSRRQTP